MEQNVTNPGGEAEYGQGEKYLNSALLNFVEDQDQFP